MIDTEAIHRELKEQFMELVNGVDENAYFRGLAQGRAEAPKPARGEEALKQIDRMARQIEECHSTIRRRNEEIKNLEADVRLLTAQACCCKGDN